MDVAIITGDLTGAVDTGVQFTCAGYRMAVAFRGAPAPPEGNLDAHYSRSEATLARAQVERLPTVPGGDLLYLRDHRAVERRDVGPVDLDHVP